MCGIVGIFNFENNEKKLPVGDVINSRDRMYRRGPDNAGLYEDEENRFVFAHRRLSIIDLNDEANQPMISSDGNLVIVFNGEISNFQELRIKLLAKGYRFKSNSDTEVILNSFLEWGTVSFKMLNGMFSFVILDKRNNALFLVRDHAGIKPLYYYLKDDKLLFCSEIRAFKAYNPNWPSNENWSVLFLSFGFIPSPLTTLKDVYSLSTGCYVKVDINTGKYEQFKFSQFSFSNSITNEREAIERIRSTFTEAVNRNMISDAPLGIFLSGGIDSSLIALIADSLGHKDLNTLSITFEEETFNEAPYQQIVLDRMRPHQHKNYKISGSGFIEKLDDIWAAMDQPSWDGINTYFVSEAAKQAGLKAVLSGLGADELFGGYPSFDKIKLMKFASYFPNFLLQTMNHIPNDKVVRFANLGSNFQVKDYLFLRGSFNPKMISEITGLKEVEISKILSEIKIENYPVSIDKNLASFLETNIYMENQLLKDTDYMSMWHSLEVRVPFLDKELMELIYSISPIIKYNSHQPKYLLTKAFEDILPHEIVFRKKQGFTFPFSIWLKRYIDVFKPMLPDTPLTQKILKQFMEDKTHWSRLWSLIVYKRFIDGI